MEIVCIRHGKTAGNLKGAYVGRNDEPLCEEGRKALQGKKVPSVELVFSSPMKRCVETAELLYPGMPLQIIEKLRECDFGLFEGHTWQELSGDPRYQAWIDSGGMAPFPEGESHEGFVTRCREGFRQVYEACRTQGVTQAALVVHGGTIMAIMDAWSEPHRDYFDWQIKNGESLLVSCQEADKGEFILRVAEETKENNR